MPAEIIRNHCMRHAMRSELEGRESCPLVARTGLIDPDVDRDTGVVRGINRRRCRTVIDKGQPTGIAMS